MIYRLKRALPALVLLALVAGAVFLLLGRKESPPSYTVELDNAFGLTESAELRAAGVRVGKVKTLKVDPKTARALVEVVVERTDFGDLRKDATCSVEPQSLIGEYFLDCEPGRSNAKLPEGATIPVERTTGTIPPDLVAATLGRPQREQFSLILSELGQGFAARGPELNETIKRAIPALRETNRVLAILGDNRRTLQVLTRDAATVLSELSGNRRDVARFVSEARDTAQISAGRRTELAETIRLLPAFLRELRPTMRDLGTVADRQTPALRDLRAASPDLTLLLRRLGPFADASRPAIDALGKASVIGTDAARESRDTIQSVGRLARTAKDPATNLRFVLEHLDDRRFATEKAPQSPGGEGFTGLEAFLRYPFVQSQAINIFDTRGYLLKLNILANECSGYTNARSAKADPGRTARCRNWLGPNQPGVTTPDPTATGATPQRVASDTAGEGRATARAAQSGRLSARPEVSAAPRTPAPAPPPAGPAPSAPSATPEGNRAAEDLLDFLVGS